MKYLIALALIATIATQPAHAGKFTDFAEWSWRSTKAVARDTGKGVAVASTWCWQNGKVVVRETCKFIKENRSEIRAFIEGVVLAGI